MFAIYRVGFVLSMKSARCTRKVHCCLSPLSSSTRLVWQENHLVISSAVRSRHHLTSPSILWDYDAPKFRYKADNNVSNRDTCTGFSLPCTNLDQPFVLNLCPLPRDSRCHTAFLADARFEYDCLVRASGAFRHGDIIVSGIESHRRPLQHK